MNDEPMPQGYEFFEHTADIGVRVTGATLSELFVNAAQALYAAMGELVVTGAQTSRTVELRAGSLEDLLHDWLSELLFEAEARQTVYDTFAIEVEPGQITGRIQGGGVDFSQAVTHEEIKAVTYHQLAVERLTDGLWQATVIFDV